MSGRARQAIARPDRRRATVRPDRLPVIAPRGLRAAVAAAALRAEDILAAVAASASFLQDRKASGSSHWPGPIQRGPGRFFGGAPAGYSAVCAIRFTSATISPPWGRVSKKE